MRRFIRALTSSLVPTAAVLGACGSIYTDSARQLAVDDHARFELRVIEARQTAAAADHLLTSGKPALEGETWEESVDECRWEFDRRVESAHDAASRLGATNPDVAALLASLDAARAELSVAAAGPATRARASLGDAVASADRYLNGARETAAASGSGGGPGAAAPR